MSDQTDDKPPEPPKPAEVVLDRPIQDALGQELRAVYNKLADKPAYLGDPALPPEFEHQLVRLETTAKVREKGVEAVRDALSSLSLDEFPEDDAGPDREGDEDAGR